MSSCAMAVTNERLDIFVTLRLGAIVNFRIFLERWIIHVNKKSSDG